MDFGLEDTQAGMVECVFLLAVRRTVRDALLCDQIVRDK